MIEGPRRTALEEMYAARLAEDAGLTKDWYIGEYIAHKYMNIDKKPFCIGVDPANPNDYVGIVRYPALDRATYPRWKLSSDWKRPSRWQRLRWRIRTLWRGVVALFSFRGRFWWAEEDE